MPRPVADTAARRRQIVERLADHVLVHGLAASSLRPLARAANLSDRMLLYYFHGKAEVISTVLDVVAARLTAALASQTAPQPLPLAALRAALVPVLLAEALWPYMRIWLEIATLAAGGDALARVNGERIARGFLAWGAAQLDCADEAERTAQAAQLLVSIEGMVLLKSMGLEDVCRAAL